MSPPNPQWNVRKPPVTAQSGAKQGLEQKMKYWAEKDYQYEFGVTVGMALNISFQEHISFIEVFKKCLEAKSDPDVIKIFDEYYTRKKRNPGGEVEIH